MSEPRLILASASPRRRELLSAIVADFDVAVSGVDEPEDPPYETLAERLAGVKAQSVAEANPDKVVLAADTVVALHGRVLGKPQDEADAITMLRALAGEWHQVYTGVVVVRDGVATSATSCSRVLIHALADDEIRAYVVSGRPLDKAGAYGIQDGDVPTVDSLDGCFCSVMGLPLWRAHELLRRASVPVRKPEFERCQECPERA